MARAAAGWRLVQARATGIYQVRFTHAGRRRSFSTGKRDSGGAAQVAARIYADVVCGRWSPGKTVSETAGHPFDEIAALWLADIEPTVDPQIFTLYQDTYVATHFAPFFKSIDR